MMSVGFIYIFLFNFYIIFFTVGCPRWSQATQMWVLRQGGHHKTLTQVPHCSCSPVHQRVPFVWQKFHFPFRFTGTSYDSSLWHSAFQVSMSSLKEWYIMRNMNGLEYRYNCKHICYMAIYNDFICTRYNVCAYTFFMWDVWLKFSGYSMLSSNTVYKDHNFQWGKNTSVE